MGGGGTEAGSVSDPEARGFIGVWSSGAVLLQQLGHANVLDL